MFGKKKKGDAAGTVEKPKKKKKAKKAKSTEGQSRFGDGGIKMLLAKNIEKIGLAAVALTALYVVFTSYSAPGLDASKQPDRLASAITQAKSKIDATSFDTVAGSRVSAPDNYEAKATADVAPVSSSDYKLTQPLEPVKFGLPKKAHRLRTAGCGRFGSHCRIGADRSRFHDQSQHDSTTC